MIKQYLNKYGMIALLLVLMVAAAAIFRSFDKQYTVGFEAGYQKRQLEESVALADARKTIVDLQQVNFDRILMSNQERNSYERQLDEAKKANVYIPEIQTTNSECNPVRSAISVLNSAAGYEYGMPENPSLNYQESRETSATTERQLIDWSESAAGKYESLRRDYLLLAGMLEQSGLLTDPEPGGPEKLR